ncbi:MAG: glycosyltransferase family 39 protein, partial [Myxococcota bacterium]
MRIRTSLLPLGVFLLTAVAQLPFFDLWFSFMDEGHMLQFADIGRKGGEFYRDATFYPLPGAFHFLGFVFDVFGPSVRVSRWIVLLEFSLFVAILFIVLRRATGSQSWALVGVFGLWLYRIWSFPHWQMYSYSTTSLLVLLACVWTLLIYFDRRDLRWLGISGLLYGLGVFCKQDYGAAAGLAIAATFWLFLATESRASRPSLVVTFSTFLLPAAAIGAMTGLYYWQAGLLEDLLRFTVFNHFMGMGAYEYTEFPDLLPLLGMDPGNRTMYSVVNHLPAIVFTADWPAAHSHFLFTDTGLYDALIKLFFFGPQVLLTGSALKLWLKRESFRSHGDPALRQRRLAEFIIFAFGCTLILLVWLNKPQDYVHLAVLYWPLIALVVVHAHDLLSGHPRRKWVAALVLCLPALVLVAYSGRLVHRFHAAHATLVDGERAGIYVKPEEAKMLEDVVSYIRENSEPDEAVAALPYFPMALFLAERMGPHRSAYIVWPFPEIPDRDQAIVDAMEAKQTDVVIYNFTQFQSFDPVWDHAPI